MEIFILDKKTSIYLDFVRFTAALVVLIGHTSGGSMTGGFLWQLGSYGQTAVMAFFVLSGYVIGFVAINKETTIKDYFIARASRIYSVVIPAIIITFLCNEFGGALIRSEYTGPWNQNEPMEYERYLLTLFMTQDIWGLKLSPTNNGPFWSISFEVFYYAFFAVLFYIRDYIKILILSLLFMASGPTIVILFPLWLIGYYAYRVHHQGEFKPNTHVANILLFFSAMLLVLSPQYREYFDYSIKGISRDSIFGDYLDAFAIFIHILMIPIVFKKYGEFLLKMGRYITFLAALTFSLHLFHQPLVRFFAGISPFIEKPGSLSNVAFVYLTTFSVVLLVGVPAERSKKHLNYLIRGGIKNLNLGQKGPGSHIPK
jgi:peptidoglycan/LPS O-acetylase OafA/YrhL